jgi:CRISPR/Cas system-associated exonuclease Cas4 (RecB family)
MHLQLTLVAANDERAGHPSASEFARLIKCRASHLMAKKAKALGQIAHERSPASDLGTKLHLANIEGPDILTPEEREDWETCQTKRAAFLTQWTADCALPVEMAKEERLWLRKGLRPLLSGKPDEILRQGPRVAVLDHKYGNYRVDEPRHNLQLGLYALLVSQEDEKIEEVTCQILSPLYAFAPVTYSREELDELYRTVQVVVASLADPGDPVPGDHCHFCPARLVCGAARDQAAQAMLAKVVELPLGEQAARLLDDIKRAQALFKEVETYYKRLLEETPGAIPGWALEPGDVRRAISDASAAQQMVESLLPLEEFLATCSVSVPQLEKAWAKKSGIPVSQGREPFKKFLGALLTENRNAPRLSRVKADTISDISPGSVKAVQN